MAATTRTSVPQGNLKDRIAALQQRNAGSSAGQGEHKPVLPISGSLRDKIASFEKKGAVPVPRGSFGLGALPVDDGSMRRHGEMYGNRVPGLSKPTLVPTSVAAPGAAPSRIRRVSTSDVTTLPPRMFADTPSPPSSVTAETPRLDSFSEYAGSPPSSPRLPSTFRTHTGRRSVSDILTKFNSLTSPVTEALPEDDEDGKAQETEDAIVAPMIVVYSDPGMVEEPEDFDLSQPSAEAISPLDGVEFQVLADASSPVSPGSDETVTAAELPSAAEQIFPSEPVSTNSINVTSLEDAEESSQVLDALAHSSNDSSGSALTSEAGPNTEDMVSSTSEDDFPSVTEGTSAGSSKVPTPTDLVDFPTMNMPPAKATEDSDGGEDSFFDAGDDNGALDAQHAILTSEAISVPRNTGLLVEVPMTPVSPQQHSPLDDADQSLVLDTSDAIIVTERVQHITPTRAMLVPVPPSLSPLSPATPTLSSSSTLSTPTSAAPSPSTFAEPSLTPKVAQRSFRATVHRKVPDALQLKHNKGPNLPDVVQGNIGEPETAGLGDLASLLADSALLEEALSGLGSPSPGENTKNAKPTQAPPSPAVISPAVLAYLDEPATPRVAEPERERESEPEEFHDPIEFPTVSEPLDLQLDLHPLPTTPMRKSAQMDAETRSLLETPPPPPPTKSPRHRYFSTFLPRKTESSTGAGGLLAMPGAYPRNSVSMSSSGDSEEESVYPAPSDASSVRSSSKSTKSRKGLARATSFAERLWHRRDHSGRSSTSTESHDDTHLSVHGQHLPPLPTVHTQTTPERRPLKSSTPAGERPTSWLSVSSMSSAGDSPMIDSRFIDAFPSVPNNLPVPPLSGYARASLSSSAGSAGGSFPTRSATLPPRHSSLAKQR